ncbi:phage portal protein [Aggregatibacter actinomycetemcomitans]|uniref:phage portal protein n=1 Tax=Aggregatibacter actinomycetemcomitans TaxID=714 RepID=UPI001F11E503|nr:phage portal protein [Aggregatibacter actinomycetemcomitans]
MKNKQPTQKPKNPDAKSFSIIPIHDRTFSISPAPALDYIGVSYDTQYNCYMPPINRHALARLPHQNAQHSGILHSRSNMVSAGYAGGKALSRMDMRALCLNLIQFGDVGLLKIRNGFGQVVRLHVLSSLYLRRKRDGGYSYLMKKSLYDSAQEIYEYAENDIIFIKLYDPMQQIYGSPDYVGGIQSALLNSDATVFRRRYFSNGAHMGFILYSTDPDLTEEMEDEIAKKIADSKGVGNFKSMFVNIAGGHPDGLKVIPIGDTGTKDEFANIKNISAQDVLTAHRFPPGLGGIIPINTAGLGDPLKYRETYQNDEISPLQEIIAETINNDPEIGVGLKVKFKTAENV